MKKHQSQRQPGKPSPERIARAVATSTAIETGQASTQVAATLAEKREKYAYLHLAL